MGAPYPFSDQQFAAVTAPLAPQVVIAGAGSGKTTVMAARVVWLVATGLVAAAGGARADLHHQGDRTSSAPASATPCGPRHPAPPGERLLDPRAQRRRRARGADRRDVQRLRRLAADRARPADRPRAGHPRGRRRVPLPARGPGGRPAPRPHRAAQRPPRDRHRLPARPRRGDERAPGPPTTCGPSRSADDRPSRRRSPRRPTRPSRTRSRRCSTRFGRREELLGLVESYRRLKRDLGLMDFSDQIELGARLADRPARGRRAGARQVPGGAARRVPGHLGGAGPDAEPTVLRPGPRARPRPRGQRGRRPQPGDLRLAGRVGLQHRRVRPGLPDGRREQRRARPTRSASTVARTPASSRPPTTSPPRSTRSSARSASSSRRPHADPGTVRVGRAPDVRRRAGLAAGPGARRPPGDAGAVLAGDRRAHPRQLPRRGRLRRADPGRDPGRDRRAPGSAPAARRWRRWSPR